jgi:hypothetical protein
MIASFMGLLIIERLAIAFSFPPLPCVMVDDQWGQHDPGTLSGTSPGGLWRAPGKTTFPLFTSAESWAVSSARSRNCSPIAWNRQPADSYALLLGVAFFLTRTIARDHFRKQKAFQEKPNLREDLRAGFDFVRRSPLLRLTAYASVLFSVLFFSVAFPFSKVVSAAFSDEAGVAGFFGLFNSITTAATFLVSLFLASRIFTRLGIINGVLLMPLTYIFCFAVFAGGYDLVGFHCTLRATGHPLRRRGHRLERPIQCCPLPKARAGAGFQ